MNMKNEFIEFAKEEYGIDITAQPSETPDTFENIFGINLIKCKDCKLKHYSESHNLWCDIFERIMPEDGYCCFSER